jgi:apolipoprotein N-acyltransferase
MIPWGWRLFALALLCGAVAAFAQAPYSAPIPMLIGFAVALRIFQNTVRVKHAALLGWALGTGYFCHALQWIVSPFMVDAARHGWMAPFALVLLAAGLALFWGAAFGAARLLSKQNSWPILLTWPAAELIRAYIFTGFPWAMPAQALVSSALGQGLALVGPYVMNAVIIAVAYYVGRPYGTVFGRRTSIGVGAVFVMLLFTPPLAGPSALTSHHVRLVQPNAAQRDKWDPALMPVFFDRQLEFTAAEPAPGAAPPDLIIWSETAIPWPLDLAEPALEQIARAAGPAMVTLGAQRRDPENYYNSMVILDAQGGISQLYDKHHLVPFGEYMPFSDLMSKFGIFGLAARLPTGYTPGIGPQLLDFGALGHALPLICYEAVFAHDVNAAPARPNFLVQVTNDAWFGKEAGPKQHLAQARMRAIEQGLPLARAANTGISAMIDPYGRIIAALELNVAGFVDAPLPRPLAPTLYSKTGDLPFALVLLLGFAGGVMRKRMV